MLLALTRRAAVIAGVIGTTAHAAGIVDDQLEPWYRRWCHSDGPKTGWHLSQPNPALVRHLDAFLGKEKSQHNILIPLCGKSVDISYLASLGHNVTGVEGVREAIQIFNKESKENLVELDQWRKDGITLWTNNNILLTYLGKKSHGRNELNHGSISIVE